jgi:hypothetical protein
MKRILFSIGLLSALFPAGKSFAQGTPNNAFQFNETATVKVPNFAAPAGDFSVEAWAKVNFIGTGTDDIISTHENGSARKGYFLEYSWGTTSVLKAGIAASNNAWVSADFNANWLPGQWHHVVMTYNAASKTIKIYQDGALMTTNTLGANSAVFSTRPLGIGCSDNYTGNGFAGNVDEVYFWDREMNATEITANAHLFHSNNVTNLRAYYKLDALTGSTVTDETSNALNGNAGTSTQAPTVVASFAPIESNPIAGFIGYKANWNSNNTSNAGGLKIVSNYSAEANYTLHGYSADSGIVTTGTPATIKSRLKRTWYTRKVGTTSSVDTLSFSLAENNIVSNYGNLFLLKSADNSAFSYVDSVPAIVSNGYATVVVPDTMTGYFTLGSTQVINLTTINRAVAVGTDDAEEYVPGGTGTIGTMDLTSSDLEIMVDGDKNQMIGVRFQNMGIPKGSQIVSAKIQFSTKGDKAPILGNAYIFAQDADNAATFDATSFNITSRTKLADSILWAGSTSSTWGTTAANTAGPDQLSPELATLVQSIVNRSNWTSNNAMALFLHGSGVRNAWSFDGSNAAAPKLIVQYIAPVTAALPVTAFPITKLSTWKYLDDGSNQDTAWRAPNFNDGGWAFGPGKLGYSDNAVTVLNYGPNAGAKYITYYFRKQFTVANVAALNDSLDLNLLRDDGAVIYINGVEVKRDNMPAGTIDYMTWAPAIVDNADETTYFPFVISKNCLVNGLNTIAVEIHQRDGTSSDLGFDMELKQHPLVVNPSLLRGPYLNSGTPTSMVIRWRTDVASTSKVTWGASALALTQSKVDTAMVTDHIVKISGLSPFTKYYYGIGSSTFTLQADATDFFQTLPVEGTADTLLRIGVIGDCGNNSTNQRDVRDHLSSYLGSNYMNAWILLGDNAYSSGFDAEYQAEFFGIYQDQFLKQNPLYPAPGNHDYGNSTSSPTVTNHAAAPYYQNFSMPDSGEAGGLASNNPAFYSYNIGNVHFLSLDSYGQEADATHLYDTTGVQVQWIKQDLAANTNKGWVVCYWHHPPYTMGSHNSDGESDLVAIRQNFIKILERYGVDLILCGHSHDYERSKLIKGHYGAEATYDPAVHELSSSSGYYDGSSNSCPYIKDSVTNYTGTVYVVSGSAGQLGGSQAGYPHNALPYSDATHGGSMILEVKGNRLDSKWIGADGVIRDHFTMMKDANQKRTIQINPGEQATLKAAYNGSYNWQGVTSSAKEVTVNPIDSMTTYVVKDSFSCVADTFVVQMRTSPLALTWGAISANAKDQYSNEVKWQTLTETNTASFDVERAVGNSAFENVGSINSAVNSQSVRNYDFIDNKIDADIPMYLYRIRQVNADGTSAYSKIVTVARNGAHTATLIVAPNPAKDNEMVIAFNKNVDVAAEVTLMDVTGRKVFTKEMMIGQTPKNFMPAMQNGLYLLTVKCDGQTFVKKIVIKN